ncbi:D-amino-acid transaminase [Virgibacillus phasianinus]|uniref:D-alanine aminotransferase n=1 Tax=Virgibacillus phasianinus TaxID=2017483 RepID=A0A220TYK4_9BACI|nr:D-amino-acid transaminase [Virgibacillus phasianinus]ASK60938.1 D-amino-acid transaminase [Virgibacillus phasianinus]
MSVYPIMLSQTKFIHRDNLHYPFEERAMQFGDGVYEVIRIYKGNYYLMKEHIDRFFRSAEAVKIRLPFTKEELTNLLNNLIQKNVVTADAKLYLQVSRGSASRDHIFPVGIDANVYGYIQEQARNVTNLQDGVKAITERDIRWEYCYIKSLNLLPNVLAKQTASEQGAYEAILHKDGMVTECSSSNVYLIKDGTIYTYPATKRILHGCVRMRVEQFAKDLNIPFNEEGFTVEDIALADEMFLSSSTSEVLPIITVDDSKIGNGYPGPITRKLQRAYEEDANISDKKIEQTN